MSLRIASTLREACLALPARGIKLIRGGAWYEWDSEGKIVAADAIGAALLHHGKLPPGLDPKNLESLVRPGLYEAACQLLDVDGFWLYRFWMGYDRGYQILAYNDKDEAVKDDVSAFGIQFAKEMFKKPLI